MNDIVCRYTYDDLGQLIREDNRAHGATYTWTYDNAGNILNRKTYAYTIDALGTVQNTVIYGYDTGNWGDLLISFNGQSIAYDGIGNPGTWNGNALTWQGRRLMSYGSNTYTYNADGIRTSKTVNGVKHIYHLSGTQILSEEWTEGSVQHILIYVYDASGQPIGMSHYENGAQRGTYVFVKNIQGDITAVYDANGTCLVTYTYDAWGNVTVSYSNGGASTAARYNPFRYRGYYYDNETGFYYLNSRYYDPNVGRFLNADIYINANGDLIGFNMFAYCGNNPVMQYDDDGEAPNSIHNAVVEHIVNQYGFKAEIYLDRYGRADLIDYDEGRVYEVKPVSYMLLFGTYKNRIMYNQICRYLIGATVESFVSESNDFRLFKRGTKPVEGQFDYGDYTVYYKLMMPGEIYYLTEPKKDAKSTASVPGMVPSKYKYTQINFQAIALGGALGIGIALIPALNGGGKGVCTQIYY